MATVIRSGQPLETPSLATAITPLAKRRWNAAALMTERRVNRRIRARGVIKFFLPDRQQSIDGQLRNISITGMFFETSALVPVGNQLRVHIDVPTQQSLSTLTLPVSVMHCTDRGVGVRIESISKLCWDRYQVFLSRCQRDLES